MNLSNNIYITPYTNKIFSTYYCTELVSYDGWCRTDDNNYNIISYSDENSYSTCKNKCFEKNGCTAFANENPKHPSYSSCYVYGNAEGQYTRGNGRTNTKCYVLAGEFVSLFK